MNKKILSKIVCPGCGWTIDSKAYLEDGACPICHYENGVTGELLTLKEIMADEHWMSYNDVDLGEFLKSIFRIVEVE